MVENDAFRTALLPGSLFGMSGDNMHDLGGDIVFESQPDPAERVPDMFAVIGFNRLAVNYFKLHQFADIG